MFTKISPQWVKSDKGFEVYSYGRFAMEYKEGNKIVRFHTEPCFDEKDNFFVWLDADAFERWIDGTPIPKDKQEEIYQNFLDAMNFKGIGVKKD